MLNLKQRQILHTCKYSLHGAGIHPAFCTMGTGPFPGVKRPGRGADHPPPSKCRGPERVELYLYSPSGPSWPVMGTTFTEYEV